MFFGCDLVHRFPGTLFRFPLRSEVTAKASEIKSEALSNTRVMGLLDDFRAYVHLTLLFVRNVRRVEVYELPEAGEGVSDEPQLTYFSEVLPTEPSDGDAVEVIASPDALDTSVNMRWPALSQFLRGSTDASGLGFSKAAFVDKLKRSPEDKLPRENDVFRIRVVSHTAADGTMHAHEELFRYFVHTRIGGGRARDMAVKESARGMKLLPWGGVAALLAHTRPSHDTEHCPPTHGRAFCFLPTPLETTLPVHVRSVLLTIVLWIAPADVARCGAGERVL
jgi:sacsin